MKRLFLSCSMILVVTAISGCVFSSDDDKEAKKGSISGTVSMTITGSPLANAKVMLVNMDAKVDTANYENNRAAFVDSALTDSEGKYAFSTVSPGKYGVVALNADTTKTYKFTLAEGSGEYQFSLNRDSRTVNFIAEDISGPGAASNMFTIVVIMKNCPSYRKGINSIINRRHWVVFFPSWEAFYYTKEVLDDTTWRVVMQFPYGYTALFYTLDNYFEFYPDLVLDGSFIISFPLSSTPAHSTFVFEYTTKTVTRTE